MKVHFWKIDLSGLVSAFFMSGTLTLSGLKSIILAFAFEIWTLDILFFYQKNHEEIHREKEVLNNARQ